MNFIQKIQARLSGLLVVALCLALSTSSWANITNIASATYKDAANNSLSATSNTVSITTPPVITSAATATADANVVFAGYQIVATNSPTSYAAPGLPAGLTINTTSGLISGTPTTPGTTAVTLSATNAAGTGTLVLTITVRGAAVVTLTKSASVANAKSGDTVTFTIQYQNTGSGDASGVAITDAIPAGSTLVTGSITGGGTLTAGTITWTVGTITAGTSGSVAFKVTVN